MSGNLHWFARVGTSRSIGMVQVPSTYVADDPRIRRRTKGHEADMDEQGQGGSKGDCPPEPDR